jgi:hypothetical protein
MHRAAGVFVVALGFMSAIAMLIQKNEKPKIIFFAEHNDRLTAKNQVKLINHYK